MEVSREANMTLQRGIPLQSSCAPVRGEKLDEVLWDYRSEEHAVCKNHQRGDCDEEGVGDMDAADVG